MADDDEPKFEIPDWWPEEFTVQRLALWAPVNWLLPIHLAPARIFVACTVMS